MGLFKTPLRYPGGKQRLTPFIQEMLNANSIDGHYAEPYAGGAGVAMELLLARRIEHVHLNDSSACIYAFWYSVVNKNEEFCELISSASITMEEWHRQRKILQKSDRRKLLELGFATFYLNRCNRSGMLSGGVIGGLDQTGNYKMDARFAKKDLITRIENIGRFKSQISVTNFDAEFYIENYIPNLPKNSLIYLDPPYYEKGGDLYLNSYRKEDHQRISKIIQKSIKHKWVLSYDGVTEILKLYDKRRHFLYDLQYNANVVYKGKEVFVFSDKLQLPEHCSLKHIAEGMKAIVNA